MLEEAAEMKRALAAALTAGAMIAGTAPAWADWSASAGVEGFHWKETTTPGVKENGLRWALDLSWVQHKEPGFTPGYNLKYYVGNVDYTGAFIGTGAPISGETHYRGFTNEFQTIYRGAQNPVDFFLALGWDHWDRRLSAAQEENWDVLYTRLGVNVNSLVKQGVFGSLGVKYSAWTRENANLTSIGFNENPRLRPGKDFSFYGTVGYRMSPAWDVVMYYDSYRFKQSNSVAVTSGGAGFIVFQPESKMDVLGVKLQHHF